MVERRDRDRRDRRFMGLYVGQVVDRDDPEGLGRVKVNVPGLLEPSSTWAWPLGSPGGGTAQRGTFDPPAVEATVGVLFNQGEVEEPYYMTGPWGAPGGTSDIPTGAQVGEGDDLRDRQVAVQEDGEWRLTRDSRTASGGQRWLLEHIGTGLSVFLDGAADKLHLVDPGADQALVRGTEYRAEEASLLTSIKTALDAAGGSLDTAGTDPTLVGLASLAAGALEAAGASLKAAATAIDGSDLTTASWALSDKAFTE